MFNGLLVHRFGPPITPSTFCGSLEAGSGIERYNRTVRGEWLGQYIFETIEEAQDQATEWLWTYNNERPNMGIGGITPAMKLKTAACILWLDPIKNGGIT